MKKETLRYQRLAGIITESQYSSKLNEYDDFNSESESVFFGQLAGKLKTFLQSEINLEDLEIDGVKIPEEETLRDAVDGMMEILGIVMKGKAYTISEKEVSPEFLNRFNSDSTRMEENSDVLDENTKSESAYNSKLEESTKWVHEFLKPHDIITLKKGTLLSVNTSYKGYVTIEIPEETEAVYLGVDNHHEAEVAITNDIGSKIGTVDFGDIKELSDIKLRWDEDENDWKVVTN
jgi:hypothetical protein